MSALAGLDRWLFLEAASWHVPWLDEVFLAASHIGARSFVWLVTASILFVFPARRAGAWRLVLTLALTGLMTDGVAKPLADRPRPYAVLDDVRVIDARPVSSSFPSGHAATAFAGAIATSRVVPEARLAWWLLALTIAVSRVYVGVHYPFDVLGGAVIGAACAWFVLGGGAWRSPPVRRLAGADE